MENIWFIYRLAEDSTHCWKVSTAVYLSSVVCAFFFCSSRKREEIIYLYVMCSRFDMTINYKFINCLMRLRSFPFYQLLVCWCCSILFLHTDSRKFVIDKYFSCFFVFRFHCQWVLSNGERICLVRTFCFPWIMELNSWNIYKVNIYPPLIFDHWQRQTICYERNTFSSSKYKWK